MVSHLNHVMLLNGHFARQLRSMVSDDAVASARKLLNAALAGKFPALPLDDGQWLLDAVATGQNLVAILWTRSPRLRPIFSIGVALDPDAAPDLWRALHETSSVPVVTNPDHPPRAPWIADRIEPAASHHLDAAFWASDFSRCLAWAWVEKMQDRRPEAGAPGGKTEPSGRAAPGPAGAGHSPRPKARQG
ncbi:hypothetical protein [Cereibacter sphaeroides]|uniref:hypothetical protein n=1 Tax=Cereibacter sphaeroides TaxID=1063 RepID=UPI001F2CB503|nr:hypothetical protein [Cereibacter sphaeroides]MCE6967113.1 hypothetical protein [Cereibacter sphaeroides]